MYVFVYVCVCICVYCMCTIVFLCVYVFACTPLSHGMHRGHKFNGGALICYAESHVRSFICILLAFSPTVPTFISPGVYTPTGGFDDGRLPPVD